MTRRNLLQAVVLAVAVGLATAVLGWYAVAALGGLWGLIGREEDRPALSFCLAAGLGWAVLLVWAASQGPLGVLATRAAGVLGVGRPVLYAVTIMFAMAVGWGSAVVGEYVSKRVTAKTL